MNARILTAATIVALSCSALPARAADPQLMNLVMPDAKVIAGVNVSRAMASPFGQYVLSQISTGDQEVQKLSTSIGFNPRTDVTELLVATTGPQAGKVQSGLVMALGSFNLTSISSAAAAAGAKQETYKGVMILEDPGQTHGIGFLSEKVVVLGDLPNIKAAIDRRNSPSALPASLAGQVSYWSNLDDAWMVSILPLASLNAPANAPQVSGLTSNTAFQGVKQVRGGVKFGATVTVNGEAEADTPDNAKAIQGVLQLMANLAAAQSTQNTQAATLLNSFVVTATGTTVKASMSLPNDQFEQLVKRPNAAGAASRPRRPAKQM